jgi:hypothetical protein
MTVESFFHPTPALRKEAACISEMYNDRVEKPKRTINIKQNYASELCSRKSTMIMRSGSRLYGLDDGMIDEL